MSAQTTLAPPPVQPLFEVIAERDRLREQIAELRRAYAEKEAEVASLMEQLQGGDPGTKYPRRVTADMLTRRAPTRTSYSSVAEPVAPAMPPSMPTLPDPAPLPHAMIAPESQGIDFGAVARLTPSELDNLPYGLITLDADGRVLHYNDTESRLVGLPKHKVLGKSFFRDVAPCTRLRDFEGRFLELARDPGRVRVQTFDFVFRFPRAEHHVTVIMTPARTRGQFHLALVRRAIVPV